MYFYKVFIFCLLFCNVLPQIADAVGITNYPPLVQSTYWTAKNKNGDDLILSADEISDFNANIRSASRTVCDLLKYPAKISGDALKTKIMDYSVLDDDLYLHGNKVSANYKDILRQQTNINSISSTIAVRYAVTVRRSSIRNLPTGEGLFYYAADKDFDALQETMLDPGEPLLVLHSSANGFFYYVQSLNYSGWISKFNIAFTDKNTWKNFAEPEKFLVVIDADYILKTQGENVLYQQGARLPLENIQKDTYTVLAPIRNKNGSLQKVKLLIPKSVSAVHYGYLPYTSNNILKSAFKFYGQPYGWGGLKNSVDCSSLIFNAYRTVGIILPRNADEQETTAGIKHKLDGNAAERRQQLTNLIPGAALYFDGHSLLYIGNINGEPYTIHSLGSYYNGNKVQKAMKVVVSDLLLHRADGNTMLLDMNTAVEYR